MRRPWVFAPGRRYTDQRGTVYVCHGTRPSAGLVLLSKEGDDSLPVAVCMGVAEEKLSPAKPESPEGEGA